MEMKKSHGFCSIVLWLGMLLLGFPGALFAQMPMDLQVDSLLVAYSHDFEYRADSELVSVALTVEPSVNCTYIQESLDVGIEEVAPPPAFSASLSLVEWNLGNSVNELEVASFVIPGENVSGRGSGSFFEPCWMGYPAAQGPLALALELTDVPGLEAFLAGARLNNNTIHARVSLDNDKQIPETNEDNNDEDDLLAPPLDLYPLTGNLFYGNAVVPLAASDIARGGCGTGQGMAMDVWGTWQPSTSDSWSPETVAVLAMQCLDLAPNGNRFDLVATVDYVVGKMTGTLNGLAVEVDNVILGTTGARPGTLTMQLPPGHTLHADDGNGRPEPRGRTSVEFTTVSPANTADFDLLQASGVTGFLHAGSIPLSFQLQTMALTATVLGGRFDKVVYQYDLALEPKDDRKSNGFISNDQRFKKPSAGPTAYSISVSGLAATIGFDAESGGLHFPALGSNWGAFSLAVQDGALVDGGSLSSEAYSLSQSPDCPGCASGGSSTFFNLTAEAGGIGWDGASVARITELGNNPEWGPHDPGSGHKIYRRLDDHTHPAVVHAPGFHAQGTGGSSDTAVVQYLLGMRAAEWDGQAVNPGAHHGLSSDDSRRGNHFMAGVSVGPSLYSTGPSNQVDVGTLGTDLSQPGNASPPTSLPELKIGFGGNPNPQYESVPSNAGTKYVIRPAGVTGVFNTDSVPQPTVYGYTMPLTRFAIRQVSNRIDDFSWVDGSVQVPGKGDFEIVFESLALECSGDIGKGLVVRETCGDQFGLDVNCNETLGAWSARMEEILAIEFQGSAGACEPSDRLLNVASVVDIKALERLVGLSADWQPNGDPLNAELTSATEQVFDSPSVDTPGFTAALSPNVTLESQPKTGGGHLGWFEFQGEVAVPFWESLDSEMRFRNTENGGIQRAQSIVYPKTSNFPDHAEMADSVLDQHLEGKPLEAQYKWGGTGWKMEFPVFFETGRYEANKSPRFLGQELSSDLVVMEVSAGTDFITPEETQISFGASADFSKLRDLAAVIDLHIDLNDPESIRKIDVFLDDIFSTGLDANDCGPICQAVGTIRSALNPLNQVVDGGIAGFIEKGIRSAVKAALGNVPDLAPGLGAIDALPEEITGRIVDSLRTELVALETPLSDALNTAVAGVYYEDTIVLRDLIVAITSNPPTPPDATAVKDVQDRLGNIISALGAVETAGNQVQTQGINRAVAAVTEIRDKKAQIFGPVTGAIGQAKAGLGVANFLSCGSDNPILDQVDQINERIVSVKDALEQLNLTPITSLAGVAGVDLSAINQAQQTIRELASDTSDRINELETRINDLCTDNLADPLTEANALLDKINAAVSGLDLEIDSFLNRLDTIPVDPNQSTGGFLGLAGKELAQAIAKVSDLKSRLNFIDDFLETALQNNPVQQLAGHEFLDIANPPVSYSFDQQWGWQNFLDAQASQAGLANWLDITEDLSKVVTDPIVTQLNAIAVEATTFLAPLTAQIPYPTVDELEDQIVALVMNSPIVVTIQDELYSFTSELTEDLNLIGIAVFDQLNNVIKEVLKAANETINEAFASATSSIPDWELGSGEMDGYALMTGDELSRLHVGAEFALGGEEDGFEFKAALDVTSWSANGKETGCGITPSAGSLLDVVISTYDLPLTLGESEILIDKLYLGFTIQDLAPVGLFGGIFTSGEIGFSEFAIYDPGLALGAGAYENYFGARAGAKFDSISMDVAFLVGRTCNQEVLVSLDPQVGEFLTFPDAGFAGLFVRGSARIPVWHNGCFLTVGVGADAGTWVLGPAPVTVGMLIGGAIYGEGACLVSVRGQITILAEVSGIDSLNPSALAALIPDNVKLQGEAFFVGGFGLDCDPGTWTDLPRSRKDDWCGTADLSTKATFDGSFHLQTPELSAIH
jgi:hypothetical protein